MPEGERAALTLANQFNFVAPRGLVRSLRFGVGDEAFGLFHHSTSDIARTLLESNGRYPTLGD
jgi:hypothetical protein